MVLVLSVPWSMWLLQNAAQTDTSVTKVILDRSWWQVLVEIEQALVPLLLIALLVSVVITIGKVAKGIEEVQRLLQASSNDISQATQSIRKVAESVQGVTDSVRTEVEGVTETVHSVNDRLRAAAAHAEDRLRRFGALVDVAQEEAEDFVISAASTLRGVRRSAKVLRRSLFFIRGNGALRARRRRRASDRDEERRRRKQEGRERPGIRTPVEDQRR
jgi:uncharacterized protein YoxC